MIDYRIKAIDSLNVAVEEKVEIKKRVGEFKGSNTEYELTGEFKYNPISYHPNLEKALNWVIDRELNTLGFDDLKAVADKIIELKEFVKSNR